MTQTIGQGIEGLRTALKGTVVLPGESSTTTRPGRYGTPTSTGGRGSSPSAPRWRTSPPRSGLPVTHGLEIAVRGGAHSSPGYGVCDDGLTIDLSRLNGVPCRPCGSAGPGPRWGAALRELDAATQAYGLAVPNGRHRAHRRRRAHPRRWHGLVEPTGRLVSSTTSSPPTGSDRRRARAAGRR